MKEFAVFIKTESGVNGFMAIKVAAESFQMGAENVTFVVAEEAVGIFLLAKIFGFVETDNLA